MASAPSPASPSLAVSDTPRAEAMRAAIVEVAERLFRTMGYQKTTVADIARELRMSPANVYRFFPSKAAINEAIATRLLGALSAHLWAIARSPAPPPDRIRLLFQALHEKMVQLFFHEKRMHDMVSAAMQEHWGIVDAYIHDIDTAIRHVVMDGQAAGVFDRALDAHGISRLIHAATVHFCHPTLIEQCVDEDLPAMAAGMAELVLRALRPLPPA
jgi:AcrR family transcriptional regulator